MEGCHGHLTMPAFLMKGQHEHILAHGEGSVEGLSEKIPIQGYEVLWHFKSQITTTKCFLNYKHQPYLPPKGQNEHNEQDLQSHTQHTSQQAPDVWHGTPAAPRPYVTPSPSSEHGSPCNIINTSGSHIPIDPAAINGPLMSLPDPHRLPQVNSILKML